MKKIAIILLLIAFCMLSGCNADQESAQIAATTKPVYDFTVLLCQGTDISVSLIVTENLSCLHDYSLQVNQMRTVEAAEMVIISGAGLEDSMEDAFACAQMIVDASDGIELHCSEHSHDHSEHHHEADPHIWLDISNARKMAQNICTALSVKYPEYSSAFRENLKNLQVKFDQLDSYGKKALSNLSCRELVTFHDGFSYFADYWDLHILHAIEEESGSEASAAELIELITIVREHSLPAIFTEASGNTAAAYIISAETDVPIFSLNMGMSEADYFETMYHNIDTIKEALE